MNRISGLKGSVIRAWQRPDLILFHAKNFLRGLFRNNYPWNNNSKRGIKQKQYHSYGEYISHQKSKLDILGNEWLSWYDKTYYQALKRRLQKDRAIKKGFRVICLAARTGAEVKAFQDMNCFAVGIDLNPGKENRHVVYGDFHDLQFPSKIADVIFTNSLDHALDLNKVVSEVHRVLKPGGFFILEIHLGECDKPKHQPGYFEASFWDKAETIMRMFAMKGFKIIRQSSFEVPWVGKHIVMRLSS